MFLRFKVRQLPLVISPLKNLGASNYSMLYWKYCCDSRHAFACQSHYRHPLAWHGYDSTVAVCVWGHPFLYVAVCLLLTVLCVNRTASVVQRSVHSPQESGVGENFFLWVILVETFKVFYNLG